MKDFTGESDSKPPSAYQDFIIEYSVDSSMQGLSYPRSSPLFDSAGPSDLIMVFRPEAQLVNSGFKNPYALIIDAPIETTF